MTVRSARIEPIFPQLGWHYGSPHPWLRASYRAVAHPRDGLGMQWLLVMPLQPPVAHPNKILGLTASSVIIDDPFA